MSYTLADILAQTITYFTNQIHVSTPAKLITYEASQQKASIKPLIKTKFVDDTTKELPVINDVPVIFLRTNQAGLTFPLDEGDLGLAIFSDRALENWLTAGGITEPGSTRKYDISDAVFFPGLYPFNDKSPALSNALQLFNKNAIIKLDNDSKIAIGDKRQGIELLDQLANLAQTLGTEGSNLTHIATYTAIGEAINKIKGSL